ncbi:transcriptional regulator [Candidatus Fermentibacteria bacterium]|nr:MAG: transcriptional regulator [Candidatus Fermentibacteria bacterium]
MKDTGARLYYSIGEVSEMLGIKPHTLHYWESAFPLLKPHKNNAGNRCYRPGDLKLIKLIDKLVNKEGYSIEGARKQLQNLKKNNGQLTLDLKDKAVAGEVLDRVCGEIESMIRDLSKQPLTEVDD